MPDWTASMQQSFEYYKVDPNTWTDEEEITTVTSSKIERDTDADTKGSASIDVTGDIGECYVRIYLITLQNRIREKHPLGTFLVQTPTQKFNGKRKIESLDAYTPLTELKENYPPLGYSVLKGTDIMSTASTLTEENLRAPVVHTTSDDKLETDFIAEISETWLEYLTALIANAKFDYDLDPLGRILFSPVQDMASLQPVWTYDDDNSSILYPDIDLERDLYGVPNAVEVLFSMDNYYLYAKAINEDPNSPVSTVSRGRQITYRETNPELYGTPTKQQLEDYAVQKLRNLLSLEHTIKYSHGYCPVRVGDCVLLNYKRAGFNNVKAVVKTQSIDCKPGCKVEETAVYTLNVGNEVTVVSDITYSEE